MVAHPGQPQPPDAPRAQGPARMRPGKAAAVAAASRRKAARRPRPPLAFDLIEPNWWLMAPAMLLVGAMAALAGGSLPTAAAAVALGLAAAIPAWTGPINRFEQARVSSETQRQTLHMAMIGGPMLLFGLAIARWTTDVAAAEWQEMIGAPVIVASFATIILNRRIASMITAVVAIWLGIGLVAGDLATAIVLTLGAIGGVIAARRQWQSDRAAAKAEQRRLLDQQRAEELLNDFEQSGQGWFFETDRRGQLVYISPTVGEILGTSANNLLGKPLSSLFSAEADGQEGERSLAFHLSARSAFTELALRAATPDEERWWSINGRPLYDEFGNFMGFRGSGHDLTEKRRSQEHASRLAHFDSLTGLANRFQMAQTLERILAAPNPAQRFCAVFLLDLDRFKQVNDTMGHPAGDELLKQVAQRLEHTVANAGRVGRLGGDEFQVIVPGSHKRDDLAELARRIIHNLSLPYQLEGHRVVIGASVGVALAPDDGVTSEALIRNADLALYAAKDGGRGRHHFYAADLHSDAEDRRQLEQDLREAISNGGLALQYQPVVHTSTERITAFEALLRWDHPVHGPMAPAKFIPVAEDAGLIAQIGEWALRTACQHLAQLPAGVRVAVNVSTLQFTNPALPAIITSALANAQVAPDRLELEITESVFLADDDVVEAMFAALKRVGVRLALDDFGTGYSSLGYLKRAPFDKIKIDQSFVRGATQPGSRNGAIIASIVSLAEALGMETTAEGVETLDELDLVRELGCSHVQGYIYDKPLRPEEAVLRLRLGMTAIAEGPRAARASRQTMLRKVTLEHGGQVYHGTIRNISASGAMVEGLWNVPPGTMFRLTLSEGQVVTATTRWCRNDRMGVEFAQPLPVDQAGRVILAPAQTGGPALFNRAIG